MKFLGLPGFLGTQSDFAPIWNSLQNSGLHFHQMTWALSTEKKSEAGLLGWSAQKAKELRQWKGSDTLIGIGYSLGGRLLASLAAEDAALFSGIIVLSSNPFGLKDHPDRGTRAASDESWAQKFLAMEWKSLLEQWNRQAIFQEGTEPERIEKDYDRNQLAHLLRAFSLSVQPDFGRQIAGLQIPQLWMAGARDTKYLTILEKVGRLPWPPGKRAHLHAIPQASHRILFDQHHAVTALVVEFARSF